MILAQYKAPIFTSGKTTVLKVPASLSKMMIMQIKRKKEKGWINPTRQGKNRIPIKERIKTVTRINHNHQDKGPGTKTAQMQRRIAYTGDLKLSKDISN
jgi:hypothetical protein